MYRMSRLTSPKREAFAKKVASDILDPETSPNMGRSYAQVYGTSLDKSYASGSRLLKDVEIQERVYELVNRHIPFDDVAKSIKKHLKAKREKWYSKRDDNGIILRDPTGQPYQIRKMEPAWEVQEKAQEKAMKAYRVYGNTDKTVGIDQSQHIHFNIDPSQAGDLVSIAQSLVQLRSNLSTTPAPGMIIEPVVEEEADDVDGEAKA